MGELSCDSQGVSCLRQSSGQCPVRTDFPVEFECVLEVFVMGEVVGSCGSIEKARAAMEGEVEGGDDDDTMVLRQG